MVDSSDFRATWRTSQPKPKKPKKSLIFPEMERSISHISANDNLHFPAQARKIKKSTPRKFLILQQTETLKKHLTFFSKENFPNLSGKGNP